MEMHQSYKKLIVIGVLSSLAAGVACFVVVSTITFFLYLPFGDPMGAMLAGAFVGALVGAIATLSAAILGHLVVFAFEKSLELQGLVGTLVGTLAALLLVHLFGTVFILFVTNGEFFLPMHDNPFGLFLNLVVGVAGAISSACFFRVRNQSLKLNTKLEINSLNFIRRPKEPP
jgi:hypothetical protein